LRDLGEGARRIQRELSGHRELLTLGYRATVTDAGRPDVDDASAMAALYATALASARDREIAAGVSLIGPHRDDLTTALDGRDVAAYCSRGQQRTVALAVKMAEAAYLRDETGEWPVLLLDDVASELDDRRRAQVFASIEPGQQVVVTTTDLTTVDSTFARRARHLRVSQGTVAVQRDLAAVAVS
jgi:DNA replication and repair protein RecF